MVWILEIAAALAYAYAGLRPAPPPRAPLRPDHLAPVILAVGLHGLALGAGVFGEQRWAVGFGAALSLFFWHCSAVHLLGSLRWPLWPLGRWIWLPAAVAIALAWLLPPGSAASGPLSPTLKLHILLSLLAYATLTLCALQALAYAARDRHLHRGEHATHALPLQVMEDLVFRLLGIGFALLVAGIATGFLFVDDFLAQHLVHKSALSVLAAVLFGILLAGRHLRGWRGRQTIRWLLGAYASLILAYFGSKLILEQLLGRSWG